MAYKEKRRYNFLTTFLKEVSFKLIYLIKGTLKTVKFWNIITILKWQFSI